MEQQRKKLEQQFAVPALYAIPTDARDGYSVHAVTLPMQIILCNLSNVKRHCVMAIFSLTPWCGSQGLDRR